MSTGLLFNWNCVTCRNHIVDHPQLDFQTSLHFYEVTRHTCIPVPILILILALDIIDRLNTII